MSVLLKQLEQGVNADGLGALRVPAGVDKVIGDAFENVEVVEVVGPPAEREDE